MSSSDQQQKALNYYKKRVDELAGENIRLDIQVSDMKLELAQKRQVLELLSQLQRSLGQSTETSEIIRTCLTQINSTIGMDKTIFLSPCEESTNVYRPSVWLGLKGNHWSRIKITVPEAVASGQEFYIFNSKAEATELSHQITTQFDLPYFVAVGIPGKDGTLGVLLSGRMVERMPHYPALNSGDGHSFQSIASYITATVENLKLATLQELDRLKTDFFANISHEFRTPITLTMGPLESLLDGTYGPINSQVAAMAEIMLRNQRRLLNLINEILDLAKLEAGAMQLSLTPVKDAKLFLNSLIEPFVVHASKRGVQIEFEAHFDSIDWHIDQEKFQKAFTNLLSNACKFTVKGSITVRAKVYQERLLIEVQDTGAGIAADQLANIFDRFKQADSTVAGTGIGLALVKEIVELHHGEISVESEPGVGTKFRMHFPLGLQSEVSVSPSNVTAVVDDDLSDIEAANDKARLQPLTKPIVLYAEDSPDLRQFVSSILGDDYILYLAADGEMGFELAKNVAPDLILSDLMMPKLNGSEFLRLAKADADLATIPFLILTAKADLSDKLNELEEGADDYLSKPFSAQELRARIKNLITIRAQHLKLKRELQAARSLQQSLLPQDECFSNGLTLEALYQPCDDLSGDFYDAIQVERFVYVYLLDVTSHGTVAAQVTYLIKGLMQKILQGPSLQQPLNELMYQFACEFKKLKLEQAVTMILLRIDPQNKSGESCHVGMEGPVLLRNNSTSRLGIGSRTFLHSDYQHSPQSFAVNQFVLESGDHIFAFSDGCFEIKSQSNGRMLGLKRFYQLLAPLSGTEWQRTLLQQIDSICHSPEILDDITVLRITLA